MSARGTRVRLAMVATAASLSLVVAGCTGSDGDDTSQASGQDGTAANQKADKPAPPPKSAATVTSNVDQGKTVPVDTVVNLKVADGTFDRVKVTTAKGKKISGKLNNAKTSWTADGLLEPGITYVAKTRATDAEGLVANERTTFKSDDLTLDEQTYPSMTPLDGETVGVGMPVIVQFDIPVTNRAAIQRHMDVTAKPATKGTWHWYNDQEVHWRPKTYWQSGTQVDVDIDINSIDAGNGVYGQMDREMSFEIGQSVIMRQNIDTHQMKVLVDGDLARTIPISAGKNGFETRSGTKLIVEKFESKRMDAATVGIEQDDPEYYNIPKVEYAQRVTFTGEFIHAAPWSVDAQGNTNVSHGCVGISTEDAAWLYNLTHRGDPVEVTGTDKGLEEGNGWTDWEVPWSEYKQGSAL